MSIRSVASTPDIITTPLMLNVSNNPLQRLIDAVKAVWNVIVHVIQSLFSCCRNAEAEPVSNGETGEGELIFLTPCSSEEETSESEIASISSPSTISPQFRSPEEKLQLVKDYQRWFLSLRETTTGTLSAIARSDQEVNGRFAYITLDIRTRYPHSYDLLLKLMLTDEIGPKLADAFAHAFQTWNSVPLMDAAISIST